MMAMLSWPPVHAESQPMTLASACGPGPSSLSTQML